MAFLAALPEIVAAAGEAGAGEAATAGAGEAASGGGGGLGRIAKMGMRFAGGNKSQQHPSPLSAGHFGESGGGGGEAATGGGSTPGDIYNEQEPGVQASAMSGMK